MSENDAILKVNGLKTYFYQARRRFQSGRWRQLYTERRNDHGDRRRIRFRKKRHQCLRHAAHAGKTGKIVDGSIIFDGVDIRSLSESQMEKFRGDRCCMIFQNPMTSLDPVFKIGHQMVEMIREHEKISKRTPGTKPLRH